MTIAQNDQGSATDHEHEPVPEAAAVIGKLESPAVIGKLEAAAVGKLDRRRRWLTASLKHSEAVPTTEIGPSLEAALRHAADAARADYAMLTTFDSAGRPTVRALAGADAAWLDFPVEPRRTITSRVIETGQPYLLAGHANGVAGENGFGALAGSAMGAPIWSVADSEVVGAVTVVRQHNKAPFTQEDLDHLTAFVAHVSVALEVDSARADRESQLLADAYARIAAELQHSVVRDLFKIGIGMQGAVFDFPEPQRSRILGYAAELDLVIERVRAAVYSVPPEPAPERRPT